MMFDKKNILKFFIKEHNFFQKIGISTKGSILSSILDDQKMIDR